VSAECKGGERREKGGVLSAEFRVPTTEPRVRKAPPASRLAPPAALVLLLALTGCDWFSTFSEQPKIDPWEQPGLSHQTAAEIEKLPFRGNPQMSVPTTGTVAAGFSISYAALPATVDSMSGIANPVPASDSSIANGHKYYAINCMPCHGAAGAGDGTATKYGMVPISLLTPITQGRTDGYIFGMMRNGRGLMPSYNRIEEMDRWDVVNYLRALQGKFANKPATGPLAPPGVTGAAVPGVTRLGPTRPVADWAQFTKGAAAAGEHNAVAAPAAGADSAAAAHGAPARPDSVARRDSTLRKGATP
jgi:mono/diheme cytochrome c family protein